MWQQLIKNLPTWLTYQPYYFFDALFIYLLSDKGQLAAANIPRKVKIEQK